MLHLCNRDIAVNQLRQAMGTLALDVGLQIVSCLFDVDWYIFTSKTITAVYVTIFLEFVIC